MRCCQFHPFSFILLHRFSHLLPTPMNAGCHNRMIDLLLTTHQPPKGDIPKSEWRESPTRYYVITLLIPGLRRQKLINGSSSTWHGPQIIDRRDSIWILWNPRHWFKKRSEGLWRLAIRDVRGCRAACILIPLGRPQLRVEVRTNWVQPRRRAASTFGVVYFDEWYWFWEGGVSNIDFFFSRNVLAPRLFGRVERKGNEKLSKSEKIRLPVFSASFV